MSPGERRLKDIDRADAGPSLNTAHWEGTPQVLLGLPECESEFRSVYCVATDPRSEETLYYVCPSLVALPATLAVLAG